MRSFRQDIRLLLGTGRGRLVGVLAIASLALGIAGNVVAFSVLDALLLRPLPYPDAERLVLVGEREESAPAVAIASLVSSHAIWAEYRDRSRVLESWAAFSPRRMSLAGADRSLPISAGRVSESFFGLLGARAVHGRLPVAEEYLEGAPPVVLLSWEHWQRRLGGAPDVLGTTLRLDAQPHEVIGVLPAGFEFLMSGVDVWLPLRADPYAALRTNRSVIALARIAPGATMAAARAEVAAIAAQLRSEYPDTHGGWTADAVNLRTEFPDRQSRRYMAILQVAVVLVLLIACANIVNLLLVRVQARRREIALRTALGATPLRIVAQLTRENMVLAVLGAAAGLLLASQAIRIIAAQFGTVLARSYQPALSMTVLLFAVATVVLCGLLFGLVPAVQVLRQEQGGMLRHGAGGHGGGRGARRFTGVLVAGEVALCLVALAAGAVLARGFIAERDRDPGYAGSRILTAELLLPHWRAQDEPGRQLIDAIVARAAALPGAAAASVVTTPPHSLFPPVDTFRVPGSAAVAPTPRAIAVRATPAYLETLQVPLVAGRFLDATDRADGAPVAVVSRALAEARFGQGAAVGAYIHTAGTTRQVVGVAENVRQSIVATGRQAEETIYTPLAERPPRLAFLLIRAAGDPAALAGPLQAALRELDPDITIHGVETLAQYAGRYLVGIDIFNTILTAFGAFALLLATLGVYGVVAYRVQQRQHEIGVRLAVGARPGQVVRMTALHGVRVAAAGLLAGALLLLPVLRLVSQVLAGFGLAPAEPLTVAAVALLLFATALAASLLPAARAAAVDPSTTLRRE